MGACARVEIVQLMAVLQGIRYRHVVHIIGRVGSDSSTPQTLVCLPSTRQREPQPHAPTNFRDGLACHTTDFRISMLHQPSSFQIFEGTKETPWFARLTSGSPRSE